MSILLVAAAMLAPAQAAPPAAGQRPVTRAELEALNKVKFDELDTTKDGALTAAELNAALGAERGALTLKGLDVDGDGKVSLAELSRQMLAVFDATDTNRDGVVTPGERAALRAAIQAAKPKAAQ